MMEAIRAWKWGLPCEEGVWKRRLCPGVPSNPTSILYESTNNYPDVGLPTYHSHWRLSWKDIKWRNQIRVLSMTRKLLKFWLDLQVKPSQVAHEVEVFTYPKFSHMWRYTANLSWFVSLLHLKRRKSDQLQQLFHHESVHKIWSAMGNFHNKFSLFTCGGIKTICGRIKDKLSLAYQDPCLTEHWECLCRSYRTVSTPSMLIFYVSIQMNNSHYQQKFRKGLQHIIVLATVTTRYVLCRSSLSSLVAR